MITFKQYFLIESMLEDIELKDDLEDNILMLHELEFKLSKLKDNPYSIHSKLFQNLFKRFYDTAYEIFENITSQLTDGFTRWKAGHQIDDPQTWAKMVFEFYTESVGGTTESTVDDIMTNGINWGQLELTPEQIRKYVDPEQAEEFVQEDIYNNPEAYEYQITQWLQKEKGFEGDEEEALSYFQENELYDEFIEYFMKNMFDPKEYDDIISPTPQSIITAIAEEMYEDYMSMDGSQLKSIITDVDDAIKRIKTATRLDVNMGNIMYDVSDKQLGKAAEKIYKAVAHMTTAISLALNVNHVNGNILADYSDISTSFMDELNDYDTTQWENEVNGIMKKY